MAIASVCTRLAVENACTNVVVECSHDGELVEAVGALKSVTKPIRQLEQLALSLLSMQFVSAAHDLKVRVERACG